ncbi:4-(cytidine 5'-diphospho)-2-C-methyl-D-erythritol kinase [Caldimonas aquatica]|uniref:4-diphosphocytidyl-2-C-methyl-D-erythritol kinase n=1 Tax=Caldimonas aquatica TaxID=376175 RepID=A0ABY6MR07_9BURK|nr:4-(cytidine 5'-diphospho)-2-C-methyl-D-erythritol kinase [Schlegelella aquatica]UZD54446.1 4-(cytidine 5'-diphospho)-2-C-methyl-D-erythritol kinase [Schlegelella aquatica]
MRALYDVPAPAKLNLFLHVLGRRDDGYHLLQSVFVPIDWMDTLHFERRDDGQLRRHDLTEPLPADDLCLRAARALQEASGCRWGVDISIDKQVPSGAGMGGGSSDAATVLLALNRLWGLHWPRARLQALGQRLGADVPFFLGPGPAWVEGIGERLSPVALPAADYFVVKPAVSLPTREIFAHPLLARDTRAAIVEDFLADPATFGKNDLQAAARALSDEVGQAGRWLEARFGNSRMTGSGSAVFAVVSARNGAAAAAPGKEARWLKELPAGWVGRLCRGLEQHPLSGWASD